MSRVRGSRGGGQGRFEAGDLADPVACEGNDQYADAVQAAGHPVARDFLGLPETLAAFRVSGHSLSASNEESVYNTQKAIMNQVAATPQFRVRLHDLLLGRLRAPAGRLRQPVGFQNAAPAADQRRLMIASGWA